MSAILKALKKLEKESAQKDDVPSRKTAGTSDSQRIHQVIIPVFMVLILFIVAGAGIILFAQKKTVPETAKIPSTVEKPVAAVHSATQPVKVVHPKEARQITPPKQSRPKVEPEHARPEYAYSTVDEAMAEKGPPSEKDVEPFPLSEVHTHDTPGYAQGSVSADNPIPPKTAVKGTSGPSGIGAQTPETPVLPEKRAITPPILPSPKTTPNQVVTEKPRPPRKAPTYDIIKDPAVKLQAISWSTDPNKRMAIINGRICREKDAVGGYVIQAIHAEDVVISKGSITGKLVFKIR